MKKLFYLNLEDSRMPEKNLLQYFISVVLLGVFEGIFLFLYFGIINNLDMPWQVNNLIQSILGFIFSSGAFFSFFLFLIRELKIIQAQNTYQRKLLFSLHLCLFILISFGQFVTFILSQLFFFNGTH